MLRAYPIKPDSPSPFDRRFRDHFPMQPIAALPERVNLRDTLGAVKYQGQEGSCAGQSGSSIRQGLEYQAHGRRVTLSPAFLYEAARYLEGTPTEDAGARLRVIQAALQWIGTVPERDDPYTPADFLIPITEALRADAAAYRITDGYWAPTLDERLNALAQGHLVQLGIDVYPSFESEAVAVTGRVPIPQPGEQSLGGHAIAEWGYDRTAQVESCLNSWGAWGDDGSFHLPFAYSSAPNRILSARVYTL